MRALWAQSLRELEHRAVSGIRIDDEVVIRKAPRQIVGVHAWHHAITIALMNVMASVAICSIEVAGAPLDARAPDTRTPLRRR
jgi:hypothetical protein